MSEHTPGPWVVKTPWGKRSEFRDVVAPGVPGFEARCKRGNANLIAAAPELKEAIFAHLESRSIVWDAGLDGPTEIERQMVAALEKVVGQE